MSASSLSDIDKIYLRGREVERVPFIPKRKIRGRRSISLSRLERKSKFCSKIPAAIPQDIMSELNISHALKIIPNFSGNSDELHRFLSCCDSIHGRLAKTEEEHFLSILNSKLSGLAYNVIKHGTFTTWETLREALNTQFSDTRSIAQLQLELIEVTQLKLEDVRSYAARVEKILWDLNDACIASEGKDVSATIINLNSKTALRSFQEGLKEPMRLIVKACRFATLKEAITKASEEEMFASKGNNSQTFTSYYHSTQFNIKLNVLKNNTTASN